MKPVRIEIDVSAANDPDSHQWLNRILHKIEDGWHVWDTTNQPEPSEIEATTWIRDRGAQGKWVRELLIKSIERSAWTLAPHGRRVRVMKRPEGANELGPEDATRIAEEPLTILVENRNSDGAFLERVVADLDRSLHQLWRRRGAPIRLDSLGGSGQMPSEVERRMQGIPYRPRLVAVVDSDRKGPDDVESSASHSLKRKCDSLGVPCWIFAKREAENYLPRVLLAERKETGTHHARLVEAWDELSDDQKDFFDMKRGLSEEPTEIEQALFDGLSPADRAILAHGFGPKVHECWTLWHVQAASELTRRGRGDLQRGIELIHKEI